MKAAPFGSHFATKLDGINHKLVCALSAATTCSDDVRPPQPQDPGPLAPIPWEPDILSPV